MANAQQMDPSPTATQEVYRAMVEERIATWCSALPANSLYAPMAYLMALPAKRVRPALVLMSCELFGGRAQDALEEALGIELFHNFTLMHDDIMDAAPLRRGQATVHVKWDVNTAILSGDAMLVKAYQLMGREARVSALFSQYALEVCEGQQLDMDHGQRDAVRVEEYLKMIRLKTAVLLSCALQVGATIARADDADRERIGRFGEHLGMAFQLRDDLLDAFGDPGKMGKQQGGDLRNGKKTLLLIRGLELSDKAGRDELRKELGRKPEERDVTRMLATLQELGVRQEAEDMVAKHDRIALSELDALEVPEHNKRPLQELAMMLMQRLR